MRILIANDDGVYAPGLAALYDALADYAECKVVAPIQDMSGASSALTLDRPLHPVSMPNGFIGLNGSPTDCVHLGLNGLLEETPDMVVSGINLGANLGDDVLYSGTVAAAIEAASLAARPLPSRWSLARRKTCRPLRISRACWWRSTTSSKCRRARCSASTCRTCRLITFVVSSLPVWDIAAVPSRRSSRPTLGARRATGYPWPGTSRMADRVPISCGDAGLRIDYPVAAGSNFS